MRPPAGDDARRGPRPGPEEGAGDGAGPAGTVGVAWAVGSGLVWSLGVGLVLLALGGLGGRPDVAVLGLAPVLGAAWALTVRPRGEVWVDVVRTGRGSAELSPRSTWELWVEEELEPHLPGAGDAPGGRRGSATGPAGRGEDGEEEDPPDIASSVRSARSTALTARLAIAAPPGTDAVRLRVGRPGHGLSEALVDVPLTRRIDVTAWSVHTGPQDLFAVEHQGIGPGTQLTGPVGSAPADRVLVLPGGRPMPDLPLPPRLRGLSGNHESRRPGEGGGLRDVHPFMPGDSARRVDWRVTARRSPDLDQLYVRRTLGLAEAVVTLVVDSRDDVGPDPATWSGIRPVRPDDATSLDLARQAAATVAQGYLAAGDRVGVEDLGVRRRALRPGAGRRQLDRVVHQLAMLRPEGDAARRLRPPPLPAAALVYLFSTFLDPESAQLAVAWRRAGHRVVAVDVLPRVREGDLPARERLALRIVRIEREDRLAEVVAAGAELVAWADADEAAVRLQHLARMTRRRAGRSG